MEHEVLKTWEEFENILRELYTAISKEKKKYSDISDPIFRGQSDSEWPLKTTLERIHGKITCEEYHEIMLTVKSQFESITGRNWDIEPYTEKENDIIPMYLEEGYSYMVHLRHHKFPSPLLDWTRSPYVAAYFAFSNINSEKDVAIYVYREFINLWKSRGGSEASIHQLGHNIKTDPRHYLQQSEYTICTKRINKKLYYWNHEEVFKQGRNGQDKLEKYILPISERKKVLNKLNTMNINEYTLFGTEDSLVFKLAVDEFIIKNT